MAAVSPVRNRGRRSYDLERRPRCLVAAPWTRSHASLTPASDVWCGRRHRCDQVRPPERRFIQRRLPLATPHPTWARSLAGRGTCSVSALGCPTVPACIPAPLTCAHALESCRDDRSWIPSCRWLGQRCIPWRSYVAVRRGRRQLCCFALILEVILIASAGDVKRSTVGRVCDARHSARPFRE